MTKKSPDPFLAHEAMDRTHLMGTMFDEFVATHPFVQSNAALRKQAEAIANRLGKLCQSIGSAAFDVQEASRTPEAMPRSAKVQLRRRRRSRG